MVFTRHAVASLSAARRVTYTERSEGRYPVYDNEMILGHPYDTKYQSVISAVAATEPRCSEPP